MNNDKAPTLDRRLLSYITSSDEQPPAAGKPQGRSEHRKETNDKLLPPLEPWLRPDIQELSDFPDETEHSEESDSDESSSRSAEAPEFSKQVSTFDETKELGDAEHSRICDEMIEDELHLLHELRQTEDMRVIEALEAEETFWANSLMQHMAEEGGLPYTDKPETHSEVIGDSPQSADMMQEEDKAAHEWEQRENDQRIVETLDEEDVFWESMLDQHEKQEAERLENDLATARLHYEQRAKEQEMLFYERRIQHEMRERSLNQARQEQEWAEMYQDAMEDRAREWDAQSSIASLSGGFDDREWDYEAEWTPDPEPKESSIGFILTVFEQHVKNYSARQLTYSSDALAAILSVFQLFSSAVPEFKTHYGVPFYSDPFQAPPLAHRTYSLQFAAGLCWSHGVDESRAVVGRNPRFPSWSWLGWQGQISNWLPDLTNSCVLACDSIFQEGVDFGNSDTERDLNSLRLPAPPKLVIQAKCWSLKFHWGRNKKFLFPQPGSSFLGFAPRETLHDPAGTDHGYYMENPDNPLQEAQLEPSRFSIPDQDFHTRLCDETWIGIPLAVNKNGYETPDEIFMLVVGRIRPEDDYLERIGIMMLPESFLYDQTPRRRHLWLG